ncbi:rod shape-determining protein RodA [Hyphobacterium marinum]|uniref:Peptidoglycan glycosyltransferase MrdB n=1 Tax=Hyphobacterium marinum TaxID=3116574 RepID=A0ABU7LZI7_9PROT|nr:rod shape-determining protein RodA [Hyphobacterium sp. Y6023]MEE2566974.1 rod shape-determining protein RodA [Hyphobacterium sp. Y6023]
MAVFRDAVPRGFRAKLYELNWALVLLLVLLGCAGIGMLYSVGEGSWDPWAIRHATRFALGMSMMLVVALFPPRFWMGMAYPIYLGALGLLVGVELFGLTIQGAQRWIDIGPIRMQPSEIMKVAVVLALARFYHDLPADKVNGPFGLLTPLFLIGAPAALILHQPDLGTTVLLVASGAVIVFLSGLSWKIIAAGAGAAAVGIPLFLRFGLEDYQRARIMTFLNPEADPMGAGYHILQSKIALGSGGFTGRGYMEGTQSHLNYLPEKQTDFIFTMLGEEFGFVGGIVILLIYALVLANAVAIATSCKSKFLRLTVMGIATTFALYVFINTGMVTGMLPVVGVPLPLISYGGTVMMTVLFGFGLILGAHIHRHAEPPQGAGLFG